MATQELAARYDSRASFYGKAKVETDYPEVRLISYVTHVATIRYNGQPDDKGTAEVYGTYSQTTLRHIKEFLSQYGFVANNAKQIIADYGKEAN
jgi:hypothetical protein